MQKQGQAQSAVVILKAHSTSKSDLEVMSKQMAQITTLCCQKNIEIIDIIVTLTTSKDISKRIKAIIEHTDIKYILVYNAATISDIEQEFLKFADQMDTWYGVSVKRLR